ncbi:hypothetical protein GCM10010174_42620 [Kutzneria viridogrisea]|uniref:Uncharacterized protein n=1 Tax=Kutzneria viridogrisea TaxID=47990 RepID=A0ABR6BP93_9PSEU|nr:hypothetical protein [Kutzneria albida]MBA8928729.1 hypothetical protein [Kutzneria viridogrisea]
MLFDPATRPDPCPVVAGLAPRITRLVDQSPDAVRDSELFGVSDSDPRAGASGGARFMTVD